MLKEHYRDIEVIKKQKVLLVTATCNSIQGIFRTKYFLIWLDLTQKRVVTLIDNLQLSGTLQIFKNGCKMGHLKYFYMNFKRPNLHSWHSPVKFNRKTSTGKELAHLRGKRWQHNLETICFLYESNEMDESVSGGIWNKFITKIFNTWSHMQYSRVRY